MEFKSTCIKIFEIVAGRLSHEYCPIGPSIVL